MFYPTTQTISTHITSVKLRSHEQRDEADTVEMSTSTQTLTRRTDMRTRTRKQSEQETYATYKPEITSSKIKIVVAKTKDGRLCRNVRVQRESEERGVLNNKMHVIRYQRSSIALGFLWLSLPLDAEPPSPLPPLYDPG